MQPVDPRLFLYELYRAVPKGRCRCGFFQGPGVYGPRFTLLSASRPTKGGCMRLPALTLITAFTLTGTAAFAQSPGNGAGATAGGSSASGGDAASATTTGSSMNGSTTGNNGPSVGLSPANDPDAGPPSNAVGNTV